MEWVLESAPSTDTDSLFKLMFILHFLHLYVAINNITVIPPMFTTISLVQQLQTAGVAVISADLAVPLVEAGWVGKGWRYGLEIGGGGRVPWRRGQRPGVILRDGEREGAVVLIGDGGCSSPWSQGLSLRQLVSQLRDTLFFLREQILTMTQQSSQGTSPPRLFCGWFIFYFIW